MSDYLQFTLAMIAIVTVWGLYSLRNENLKAYFSTDTGKGILKGIVMALVFSALFGLASQVKAGTFFNYAEVIAGLEATKKSNPMCVGGTVDDRTGSNIGLRLNIYKSENFDLNLGYTHHSCAFSEDDRSYDAAGIELKYRFFTR